MQQQTYTLHYGPSHGWLEVPAAALMAVQLTPGAFSEYSYIETKGPGNYTLYLEEDCDAPVFCID